MRMLKQNWKTFALWIGLAEAVGGLSAWLSREGMKEYSETVAQPPLSPPMWLFPVVWGILFLLMGYSAGRIYLAPESRERSRGLNLFVAQLIINFFWSLIFFNAKAYGFAFVWLILLWLLIFWMILAFYKVDKTAAILQIPYLLSDGQQHRYYIYIHIFRIECL